MNYLLKILILIIATIHLVRAQCSNDCQTLQNTKPVIKYLTNTLNTKYPPVECSLQCPSNINCEQFINTTLAVYTYTYNYYNYGWVRTKTNQIQPYYDSASNSIKSKDNLETSYSYYNFFSVNI